jgi:hypothetical protein
MYSTIAKQRDSGNVLPVASEPWHNIQPTLVEFEARVQQKKTSQIDNMKEKKYFPMMKEKIITI